MWFSTETILVGSYVGMTDLSYPLSYPTLGWKKDDAKTE